MCFSDDEPLPSDSEEEEEDTRKQVNAESTRVSDHRSQMLGRGHNKECYVDLTTGQEKVKLLFSFWFLLKPVFIVSCHILVSMSTNLAVQSLVILS